MAACEKCGAQLTAYVPKCQYCNTITAFGAAQEAEQLRLQVEQGRYQAAAQFQASQYEQARATQAQFAAGMEVQRSAEQAFNWALAGLFLCCIPILPIVGIVLGFRTRSVAVSRGMVVPTKAILAISLGFASLGLFGGGIAFSQHIEAEKANRRASLEKSIGKHAADSAPSVDVTCKMSELYLLDNDFKGTHFNDGSVNCDGAKWNPSDERGELTGVRIKMTGSGAAQEANVCFKRGQKWVVDAVVSTSCSDYLRDKAASATATATAAAPPTIMPPAQGDPLGPTPKTSASPKAPRSPTIR